MKALAIIRSSVSESIEDQQKWMEAFAQSEGIEITHTVIKGAEDPDFVYVEKTLRLVDIVVVTDFSRITRRADRLKEFKKLLDIHNVKLISMTGE